MICSECGSMNLRSCLCGDCVHKKDLLIMNFTLLTKKYLRHLPQPQADRVRDFLKRNHLNSILRKEPHGSS